MKGTLRAFNPKPCTRGLRAALHGLLQAMPVQESSASLRQAQGAIQRHTALPACLTRGLHTAAQSTETFSRPGMSQLFQGKTDTRNPRNNPAEQNHG